MHICVYGNMKAEFGSPVIRRGEDENCLNEETRKQLSREVQRYKGLA